MDALALDAVSDHLGWYSVTFQIAYFDLLSKIYKKQVFSWP